MYFGDPSVLFRQRMRQRLGLPDTEDGLGEGGGTPTPLPIHRPPFGPNGPLPVGSGTGQGPITSPAPPPMLPKRLPNPSWGPPYRPIVGAPYQPPMEGGGYPTPMPMQQPVDTTFTRGDRGGMMDNPFGNPYFRLRGF